MQLVNDLSDKGEKEEGKHLPHFKVTLEGEGSGSEPSSDRGEDDDDDDENDKEEDDTQSMLVVPHGDYSHTHVRRRKRHNLQSEEERTGMKLEALLKNTMTFMSETLHHTDRRETFEKWLFKLADVHGNGQIGLRELEMLMKGLEFDGITCEDLTTDSNRTRSDAERAQCLMDEYDTNKSGFLTEDEFMLLARAITMNYQLHSADLHSDMIGGYQLSKKLSQGGGSMIRVGTTRKGKRRAVQVIPTKDLASQFIITEVKQLTRIFHPNVVHMEEVFEANDLSFFVMELVCGGNLGAHLKMGPFSESQAQNFFRQILKGVDYCHSQLVFHRDLMLEDVLLMNDGATVKVGRFGNAIRTGCRSRIPWNMLNIPPEAVKGSGVASAKLDVWALGVLLYRMLAGIPPFFSENPEEMKEMILKGSYPALTDCSDEATDIVKRMLVTDPEKRATMQELLSHPWVDCKPNPWVPSLLHEEYHADCESMSRDIIIMILHDIIRQHNIRTFHQKKDSEDVICQALNRDLKFLIRVGSTKKRDQEEMQQVEQAKKDSEDKKEMKEEETVTPTEETKLPDLAPPESTDGTTQDSPDLVPMLMQNESGIMTEEHLFLQFVMLEGYGAEFRSVVDSIETALERHLRAAALVKAAPPTCLNTDLLLQNAAVVAEQFRELFTNDLQCEKATVLMIGKTGAGKSSLANRIFGTTLSEVGHGKCVTSHFTRCELEGKPVVIYDSKGYQVDTVQEFEDEILQFFAIHSGDTKEDRIHVVWYVVDGTSCRFEPFEKVFCSTVLADVPKIILVNKADLCRPQEIQALKKTIEGLQIPKCASVMPTVAVETLKPPPDKCPKCGSDDVSALRKKRIWKCNECDHVGSLENKSSLEDTMLRRVVEATQMIVPEYVKEAFISGQRISINTKVACTKGIITECFNAFKDTNSKLAIPRVLRLLARICSLWDIASGDPNEDTVAMPVARQVLSMALPLLGQGGTQEDMELSDEIRKDAESGQESGRKDDEQHENENASAQRDDDMKWTWVFVGNVQKTLGVLDRKFIPDEGRVRIAHQRPQAAGLLQSDLRRLEPTSFGSCSRYSLDSSRPAMVHTRTGCVKTGEHEKSELSEAEVRGKARSRSSSGSSSSSPVSYEQILSQEFSQDPARSRLSLDITAGDLYRTNSGTLTRQITREDSGDPETSTTDSQHPVCPSHACLVTTAVAIAWSESLMKMHLLLVERGIKVQRGLSTVARVRGCFDRAFASFNIDRIEMVEEKLAQQPLNDVLDNILVMPDLPPPSARVGPSSSPSPMYSVLSPPVITRYQHSVSAAGSPSVPDQ